MTPKAKLADDRLLSEEDAARLRDPDRVALREFVRKIVAEDDAYAQENYHKIICADETARMYFYDGMSDEENLATRRYLVRHGLAEWVVKDVR